MTETVRVNFVLVGPHAGKTMSVCGRAFEEGSYVFEGKQSEADSLARLLDYYSAYPEDRVPVLPDVVPSLPPVGDATSTVGPDPATAPIGGAGAGAALQLTPAEALARALGELDPEADDHWTSSNLPAIGHLEAVLGRDVSREEVEALASGFTRAKAREARRAST